MTTKKLIVGLFLGTQVTEPYYGISLPESMQYIDDKKGF